MGSISMAGRGATGSAAAPGPGRPTGGATTVSTVLHGCSRRRRRGCGLAHQEHDRQPDDQHGQAAERAPEPARAARSAGHPASSTHARSNDGRWAAAFAPARAARRAFVTNPTLRPWDVQPSRLRLACPDRSDPIAAQNVTGSLGRLDNGAADSRFVRERLAAAQLLLQLGERVVDGALRRQLVQLALGRRRFSASARPGPRPGLPPPRPCRSSRPSGRSRRTRMSCPTAGSPSCWRGPWRAASPGAA